MPDAVLSSHPDLIGHHFRRLSGIDVVRFFFKRKEKGTNRRRWVLVHWGTGGQPRWVEETLRGKKLHRIEHANLQSEQCTAADNAAMEIYR